MGRASSHDIVGGILKKDDPDYRHKRARLNKQKISYRVLGEAWWPQELPSQAELEEAMKNLDKVNYKVDYIITHCCGSKLQDKLAGERGISHDIMTDFLEEVEEKVDYKHWYFGHYHDDINIDSKHTLVYQFILPLEN